MITSLQQKNKTLEKLARLQAQLEAPVKLGIPDTVVAMNHAQIDDVISLLRADVNAYDAACEATLDMLKFNSYEDLCKLPIVVRLANKLTLADFLPQQVSVKTSSNSMNLMTTKMPPTTFSAPYSRRSILTLPVMLVIVRRNTT